MKARTSILGLAIALAFALTGCSEDTSTMSRTHRRPRRFRPSRACSSTSA